MTQTIELESELLPTDHEFEQMRDRLLDRIDQPVHLVPRKRRKVRRRVATVSGLLAAAVAATLVITNVAGPHGATAEAAEVLHSAAVAAIDSTDPVVGSGQFLKIDMTEAAIEFGDHAAFVSPQRVIFYVPADRSANWIISRQQLPAGKQYGDASADIKALWDSPRADGHKVGDVVLTVASAGKFVSSPLPLTELAQLPTDANALRDYVYAHATGDLPKDQEVYVELRQLLITGLAPAKLRAAIYEVLAQLPGVYLSSGKANLDGRIGVGISLLDSTGRYIQQVIIDPDTGLLIGARDLDVKSEGPVPAGVSQDWTSVSTSVVDTAPAGPFATEQAPR